MVQGLAYLRNLPASPPAATPPGHGGERGCLGGVRVKVWPLSRVIAVAVLQGASHLAEVPAC